LSTCIRDEKVWFNPTGAGEVIGGSEMGVDCGAVVGDPGTEGE